MAVVLGDEEQDLELMRGSDGTALVYDENMERLEPGADADRASREAEDRRWPDPALWESGPDALRYPGLYDPHPDDGSGENPWPEDSDEPDTASVL